jgi:hypothetical protein
MLFVLTCFLIVSFQFVPETLVDLFSVPDEMLIFLFDCNGKMYMCELETVLGEKHVTTGWGAFLAETGASFGDYMVFDIVGADNVLVSVFRPNGSEKCPGDHCQSSVDTNGDRSFFWFCICFGFYAIVSFAY